MVHQGVVFLESLTTRRRILINQAERKQMKFAGWVTKIGSFTWESKAKTYSKNKTEKTRPSSPPRIYSARKVRGGLARGNVLAEGDAGMGSGNIDEEDVVLGPCLDDPGSVSASDPDFF